MVLWKLACHTALLLQSHSEKYDVTET